MSSTHVAISGYRSANPIPTRRVARNARTSHQRREGRFAHRRHGPSNLTCSTNKLQKLAGQPCGELRAAMTAWAKRPSRPLMASLAIFAQHGESGIWVSDLYPEIATCVDDMAVIRSCGPTASRSRQRVRNEYGQYSHGPAVRRLLGACMGWGHSAKTCPATSFSPLS